jgi:hypothetical protein
MVRLDNWVFLKSSESALVIQLEAKLKQTVHLDQKYAV